MRYIFGEFDMNTRRDFLKKTSFGAAAALSAGSLSSIAMAARKAKRPNIIWLISEDNSVHYSNLYNKDGVNMPNVNKLAKKGVIFDHAFSNCAVCSAARTTPATCRPLILGRSPVDRSRPSRQARPTRQRADSRRSPSRQPLPTALVWA